jgi:hypothetical protein
MTRHGFRIALLPAAVLLGVTTAGAAPKLVMKEKPTFDVGAVFRPAPLAHVFLITNAGDEDLTLDVQPHCGCTLADVDKIIKPGKTGKVKLSVATARFVGFVSKTAAMRSNDPAHASMELAVEGTVKTHVSVSPSETITLRGHVGEAPRKELLLMSDQPTPIVVTNVASSLPVIRHETRGTADGKAVELFAWMDENAPIENVNGTITFSTNVPAQPSVTINVFGQVLGPIEATPASVFFAVAAVQATPATQAVTLAHWKAQPFQITAASVDAGTLGQALDVKYAGKVVTIAYRGGLTTGSYTSAVVLTISDAVQKEVRIPVRVTVG